MLKKNLTLLLGIILFLGWRFSNRFITNPDYFKINVKGEYIPFQGVTVVASIGAQNKEMWQKIYEELNQNRLLKQFYTLLPVDSYHLTTLNLFTERSKKTGNWKDFITGQLPFFQNINKKLEAEAFHPHVKLERPGVAKTLQITIQLDKEEKEKIQSLGKEFSQQKNVPNPLHVTLGYLYRDMGKGTRDQIFLKLQRIMKKILASYKKPVVLDTPKLCYFKDMQEFIPWNGDTNPF